MRLSAVAIAICFSLPALSMPIPENTKPQVILQEIKPIADTRKLLYPARVEAKVNSTVTADLNGHVKRMMKTLGAKVRKGEIVLYLENKDPAFTYAAVPVRSPVAGVISQIHFQLMSDVAKGEKLFTVINSDALKVEVEIPFSEISQLKAGTQGAFRASPSSEGPLPVQVVGLSPAVDPRSGTAAAELEFLQPPSLPVGTVGQVSFQISSGAIILLPENSINYVDGKPTVRVIDGQNKSHRKIVELGDPREDSFIIKSGLLLGDRVVVRASRALKDGEEVEPQIPETNKRDRK